MTAELKAKSQVTIPMSIVKSMSLKQGDLFDVFEENGRIVLVPVVLYPKSYVEQLEREARAKNTSSKTYDNVDDLISSLEEE